MKLNAEIAGITHRVDFRRDGSVLFADINGRCYELEAHESADGYLLIHNGRVFDCRVDGRPESGKPIDVVVGTTYHAVTLVDPKRLRGASSVGAHADKAARIVALMPGKVVRLLAAVGDKVESGAGIVVVEAMKMQNELKSPKAGTVVALNARVGVTVNSGDVLAVIE
jgi:biotin carboxyl carrier protein